MLHRDALRDGLILPTGLLKYIPTLGDNDWSTRHIHHPLARLRKIDFSRLDNDSVSSGRKPRKGDRELRPIDLCLTGCGVLGPVTPSNDRHDVCGPDLSSVEKDQNDGD